MVGQKGDLDSAITLSHTTFFDSVPGNFFLFGRDFFSLWRKNGAVEREKFTI